MKEYKLCMLSVLFFIGQNVLSQSKVQKKISKTYSFRKKNSQNTILFFNINGGCDRHEGIQGDRVIMKLLKRLPLRQNDRHHLGKERNTIG